MSMTITDAERAGHRPMVTVSDRYLNLAMMNIGEAITAVANIRQRGGIAGNEMTPAVLALNRASASLRGVLYAEPTDLPEKIAAEVVKERRRQLEVERFTLEDDANRGPDILSRAAACYATPNPAGVIPAGWPFGNEWWKPTTRRRDMVKAAALLLAEIERLDRSGGIDALQNRG